MTINNFQPGPISRMDEGSVRVVKRIQKEFCFEFGDLELAGVATVGDLYAVVLGKVETDDLSRAFFRLRGAMATVLKRPGKSIRAGTQLALLLPESSRKRSWKQLAEVSGLKFPRLRHPKWARGVIRTFALAGAILSQVLIVDWVHPRGAWWVAVEFAVLTVFVIVRQSLVVATGNLGLELPVRTVGELVRILLSNNESQFAPEAVSPAPGSGKEVWEQLVLILASEMGVDAESITEATRFEERPTAD